MFNSNFIDFQEKKIISFFEGFTKIKIQKKFYTDLFVSFRETLLLELDKTLLIKGIESLLNTNHLLLRNTSSRYNLIESVDKYYLSNLINSIPINPDFISKSKIDISDAQTLFYKSLALVNFLDNKKLINQGHLLFFKFNFAFFDYLYEFSNSSFRQEEFLSILNDAKYLEYKNDAKVAFLTGIIYSYSFDEALAGFDEFLYFIENSFSLDNTPYFDQRRVSSKEKIQEAIVSKIINMKTILNLAKHYKNSL